MGISWIGWVAFSLAVGFTSACSQDSGDSVAVDAGSDLGPDDTLVITVMNPPEERFTLRTQTSAGNVDYVNELVFADGRSDPRLRPAGETSAAYVVDDPYELVDPAHSNESAFDHQQSTIEADDLEPKEVMFTLLQGDVEIASTTVSIDTAPGVRLVAETTDQALGFHAFLLARPELCPCPTIAVFGGSEGGANLHPGAALASDGYAVVVVAYFGLEGLPARLEGIDIEVGLNAIDWALGYEAARAPVGVWGGSRGSELAVETALLEHRVEAVVLTAPSSARWIGQSGAPAWLIDGQPLAALQPLGSRNFDNGTWELLPAFAQALDAVESDDPAMLRVDNLAAPVLLLSGADDRLWPSSEMARAIVERRCSVSRNLVTQSLVFSQAGHIVTALPVQGPPPSSTRAAGATIALGGTPDGNLAAASQS